MKNFILFKAFSLTYNSRQGRPNQRNSGFTFPEVIASIVMSSIILASAFGGFFSIREIFARDKVKLDVNQRLRTVFATMGPDIQQTGEGLVSDPKFPVLLITEENIPSTTIKTSEIVLRKTLLPLSLYTCEDITAGNSDPVMVMDEGSTESACKVSLHDSQPVDGWPDGVKKWQDRRNNKGGDIRAYIYDSDTGKGEFFDYSGEETKDSDGNTITPSDTNPAYTLTLQSNGGHTWQNDYPVGSVIYLMEERRYRVKDNKLQLVVNDSETSDLVENVKKLEVKAILSEEKNGTEYECKVIPPTANCTPTFPNPTTNYSWAQIKFIDITAKLSPGEDSNSNTVGNLQEEDLELSQRFFPRNSLSF